MLNDAYREGKVGVDIHIRTDDKLFNLRRLQAKSKVTKDTAPDFLFTDDCALNDANQFDMQRSKDQFATACNNFVNTKKTEVMYQPAPSTPYTEPVITANVQKVAPTEKFVYSACHASGCLFC